MKILKYIREEIVPLSRQQNIVLLVIITCIFQFVLFYAPTLADEAVKEANQTQQTGLNTDVINNIGTEADKIVFDEINEDTQASTTPEVKVVRVSTHVITAYNSEIGQTDDDPCTTANGYNLCKNNQEDSIAANFLEFGAKVRIPELFGDRVFVVRDRMNSRHATRVDVWMKTRSDALKFGLKTAKIEVIEEI